MSKSNRMLVASIFIVLASVVIAIGLYCIPAVEKVNFTFHGYEMTPAGTADGQSEIAFSAVKYHYLFRDDVYHSISLEINGKEYNTSSYTNDITYWVHPSKAFDWIQFLDFTYNDIITFGIALDHNSTWIGVTVITSDSDKQYFIGSSQQDFNPTELWQIIGDFIA